MAIPVSDEVLLQILFTREGIPRRGNVAADALRESLTPKQYIRLIKLAEDNHYD